MNHIASIHEHKEHQEIPIKIISGDCYVTKNPNEVLMTVLGSCVAACIRDPILQIGGMNHFLLPDTDEDLISGSSKSARYGVYAMELLINKLLKEGAAKDRLEVKVFGGSNVNPLLGSIGDKNVNFIREFLRNDGFRITSEDLGGINARKVHYYACIGKVLVREVKTISAIDIAKQEKEYQRTLNIKTDVNDVELF